MLQTPRSEDRHNALPSQVPSAVPTPSSYSFPRSPKCPTSGVSPPATQEAQAQHFKVVLDSSLSTHNASASPMGVSYPQQPNSQKPALSPAPLRRPGRVSHHPVSPGPQNSPSPPGALQMPASSASLRTAPQHRAPLQHAPSSTHPPPPAPDEMRLVTPSCCWFVMRAMNLAISQVYWPFGHLLV